jgi:Protein of unknown function (DUF3455)
VVVTSVSCERCKLGIVMLRLAAISILAIVGAQAQTAPSSIEAPQNSRLMMTVKGEGAQVYTCTDAHWILKAPDAKLFDKDGKQAGTHFAGPTWKLNDGGEVKGKAIANQPSPDAGSIPWLLVQAVPGSASGSLAEVAYIRRTETHGGAAPKEACTGTTLSIPYSATYTFYTGK